MTVEEYEERSGAAKKEGIMENRIITISREFGSGGREIGRMGKFINGR